MRNLLTSAVIAMALAVPTATTVMMVPTEAAAHHNDCNSACRRAKNERARQAARAAVIRNFGGQACAACGTQDRDRDRDNDGSTDWF